MFFSIVGVFLIVIVGFFVCDFVWVGSGLGFVSGEVSFRVFIVGRRCLFLGLLEFLCRMSLVFRR